KQGVTDADVFCNVLLEKYHVALVSGGSFGLDGSVRFSYANSMQNLIEGSRRFAEFLSSLEG
ncbi:MAG TPA: aspartate aminotransferase, partial [Candidatus Cloacimonadota bacterium]|nr:aspartate aminotransferase [Candidatus Cloacimonadota bacterium]